MRRCRPRSRWSCCRCPVAMSAKRHTLEQVGSYCADARSAFPPKSTHGNDDGAMGRPQLFWAAVGVCEGHVVVAVGLIGRGLHRCEREVRARVRRVVERQRRDVPVPHGRVDLARARRLNVPNLESATYMRPSFGGADRAELRPDVEQIRLAVRRQPGVADGCGRRHAHCSGRATRVLEGDRCHLPVTAAASACPPAGERSDRRWTRHHRPPRRRRAATTITRHDDGAQSERVAGPAAGGRRAAAAVLGAPVRSAEFLAVVGGVRRLGFSGTGAYGLCGLRHEGSPWLVERREGAPQRVDA